MSIANQFWSRAKSKYRRTCADRFYRRPFHVAANPPIISFTFDDFPRTALHTGGAILHEHGAVATYYVSLGLAGTEQPSGLMFTLDDLATLRGHGHELGCHTYTHCDSSLTPTDRFTQSVIDNQLALRRIAPSLSFATFSYPISAPRARTKLRMGERFLCCRGGGQTFNAGLSDLNYLRAYFLEKTPDDDDALRHMIDLNAKACGWLVIATHDVCAKPSPFGCTPEFFNFVVRYAVRSGARVLPVAEALRQLRQIV
jgi:peptidoglycan/xylan/chitin deacetylase (PgdA/CDA1 family)